MSGGFERKPGGSSLVHETFESSLAVAPGPGKRTLTEQLDRVMAPVVSQAAPTLQSPSRIGGDTSSAEADKHSPPHERGGNATALAATARGSSGTGGATPHLDTIANRGVSGVSGPAGVLAHLDTIEQSSKPIHDPSGVHSYVDSPAAPVTGDVHAHARSTAADPHPDHNHSSDVASAPAHHGEAHSDVQPRETHATGTVIPRANTDVGDAIDHTEAAKHDTPMHDRESGDPVDHPLPDPSAAPSASPEASGADASVSKTHVAAVSTPEPERDSGEQTDEIGEDRQARAEIRGLVQVFRGMTGHWLEQLSAAGTHAAQGIQKTTEEQKGAVEQHAERHGASLREQFAVQRTAAAAGLARHQQELAAGIQRESQHVQTHATQQSTSVAQDSAAKQAAIEQAAASHSTAVNAAGASQAQRVHTVLGAQAARMGQRGAAAVGSYGAGEKGHAQGVAAQEVAGKGQSAIRQPGPAIAGDVNQTASHSSQKIVATGKGAASRLHAGLPVTQQRIHGVAQKTVAGLRKMEQSAAHQLTATHGKVTAGLHRKEGEAHSALRHQARKAGATLTSAATRHRRELNDAVRTAAGKVRTATAALARAAARGRDLQTVAPALEQAKNLLGANIGRFIDRMTDGVAGFRERASQKGAEVRQHLAQGSQAAQSQAHQIATQSNTAGQHLNAQGLAHAAQGAAQTAQGIGHEAAQAHAHHQQVAQAATARFAQAATQTTERLGSTVDQATSQNESHVGG